MGFFDLSNMQPISKSKAGPNRKEQHVGRMQLLTLPNFWGGVNSAKEHSKTKSTPIGALITF
jgi:hypothetical protein